MQLEDEVAALLPEAGWTARPPAHYIAARDRWTEAVWDAAVSAGAVSLDAADVAHGLALSTRPLFVCGVHRSGTTLLRDLLDDHPQVSVIPSEGSYFTNLYHRILGHPESDRLRVLCREWIGRLANPINQPPFWVMGRTVPARSPYVQFARHLMAWWAELDRQDSHGRLVRPHLALLLAYASCRAETEPVSAISWLIEKTPTLELHRHRIWRALPDARFIQLVRDPYSVFASRKRSEEQALGSFISMRTALREMERSYAIAAGHCQDRCLVVRYEELVASPSATMATVAGFLGIAWSEALLRPTVAGSPAAANSSFGVAVPGSVSCEFTDRSTELTADEREAVTAFAGPGAATLGYAMDPISPLRRVAVRARYRKVRLPSLTR